MNKFQIGDKITGTAESNDVYAVTNSETLCEVTHVFDNFDGSSILAVRVIDGVDNAHFIVQGKYFVRIEN